LVGPSFLPTFSGYQPTTGNGKDVMGVRYYANIAERLELIAGLRALAEFLEADEDIPAPKWADVIVFPDDSSNDDEQRAEIDGIAARIGTDAKESASGHYSASRIFGRVRYRAVAIPANTEEA
jgi:hypothetical protein